MFLFNASIEMRPPKQQDTMTCAERERERDVIIPNSPAVIVTLSTIVIDSLHMKEKHRTSFILGIDGLKTRDVRFLSTLDSQVFIRRHRGSTEKKVRNMQTLTWRIWSNSLI